MMCNDNMLTTNFRIANGKVINKSNEAMTLVRDNNVKTKCMREMFTLLAARNFSFSNESTTNSCRGRFNLSYVMHEAMCAIGGIALGDKASVLDSIGDKLIELETARCQHRAHKRTTPTLHICKRRIDFSNCDNEQTLRKVPFSIRIVDKVKKPAVDKKIVSFVFPSKNGKRDLPHTRTVK